MKFIKPQIAFFVALTCLTIVPVPGMAASIDLYPPFADFALRNPQYPPPPGKPDLYSATGATPSWMVSQWDIAGGKLSSFKSSTAGEKTIFTSTAPAASITVEKSQTSVIVKLTQNGAAVPCLMASGKPRESDLFLSSVSHAHGVVADRPSGYSLSNLSALREIVKISVDAQPSTPSKGCKVSKGGAVLAIIMTNFQSRPYQTFFYQMTLNRYCRADIPGAVCNKPAPMPSPFSTTNPFGSDDHLALAGTAELQNGEVRDLNVDLLPRLKLAIQTGAPAMDRDPSHWSVTGAYMGLISFGDVKLTSSWENFRLVAETK